MEEETRPPPIVFANKVIRQFVDNLYGKDKSLKFNDFMVIRVTFRKLGGDWFALCLGDILQLMLLVQVIRTWASR